MRPKLIPPPDAHTMVSAPRGKILMMAVIAGAVITNIYCTQPILPLIQSGLGVDLAAVNLVAGAALLGFATGLALLLPLGAAMSGAGWCWGRSRWPSLVPWRRRWRLASGR